MPNLVQDPTDTVAAVMPVATCDAQPVAVQGCFGWLHTPGPLGPAAADVAVLICTALTWDGLHAHHGFRLLANQLAAAGYPTLRFQYPGTGDSVDLPAPDEADHWQRWLQSVHANADWLLAATGASRLLLVGLRFGAVLAAKCAEARPDVSGLVLLAPVLRGKSYMRQLDMEARLEGAGGNDAAGGGLDLHELQFGAATVRTIAALDLRQLRLPAGLPMALVPQAPSQVLDSCIQAWTGGGLDVHRLPFEGLDPLLQDAIHADLPAPDFSHVMTWVGRVTPAGALLPCAKPGSVRPGGLPRTMALHLGSCIEAPLHFGKHGGLFGILCRPVAGQGGRVVIIGNTGRDPHYGIARFGVDLARRLAAEGVASLRMDFAGLGDSTSADAGGDRLSALFETDRAADIGAAIDALGQLGFDQFAVQGLCSGAYHALRTSLTDRRIDALLLVNLPVFQWQGGVSVKQALWANASARRVLERIMDPATWRRALAGQASLRPFLRALGRRALDGARRWVPLLPQAVPEPKRAMTILAKRGVRSLLIYSAGDPGLDVIEASFGCGGAGLSAYPGVRLHVIAGGDHVLSGRHMRETVIGETLTFLADSCRSQMHDHPLDDHGSDDDHRPLAKADAGALAG